MLFGLINIPATCQQFVNKELGELLEKSVIICLNDILIHSENPEFHDDHVEKFYKILNIKLCSLSPRNVNLVSTQQPFSVLWSLMVSITIALR